VAEKLLKIFLVNRVQEYFLLNFCVVSLAFQGFHLAGVKTFVQSTDSAWGTAFCLAIIDLMGLGLVIAIILKGKEYTREGALAISSVPLTILAPVSIVSLAMSIVGDTSAIEVLISLILLAKYGIQFLIIMVYTFLAKYGSRQNRVYVAIRKRFEDAVGDYQVARSEGVLLIVAGVAAVYTLRFSGLNPFAQYLSAFALVDILAHNIQKLRLQKIPILKFKKMFR
jgi:hypothetical protein